MVQVNRLKVFWQWGQKHPAVVAMAVVLLVYLVYLPTTTYPMQYYDATAYWEFAEQYYATGSFAFLSYASLLRGYLFPLLLSPLTQLANSCNWSALDIMRVVGAGLAAVVFGWAGPALWQATTGSPRVPIVRRLVFAAVGFVLWRDYFNFSLTDFPALLALAIALIALLRGQGVASSVLAGIALAAALNMRPVYQASLPTALLLALLPPVGRARWWGAVRGVGLAVGASLVMLPQAYSNFHQVGIKTPWVLTSEPSQPNIFLKQLTWGLTLQKYETNVGEDFAGPFMNFEDPQGIELWKSTGLENFANVNQYIQLCLDHPQQAVGVWLRHLFNGIDIQYPTPYVQAVFVPTWQLAWLNYSVVWGGLGILVLQRWYRSGKEWVRPALVILTLLMPCLVTLVTAIECRFLLPLHLLLSAAVAFGAAPIKWWHSASKLGRTATLVSYVVVVGLCFAASASAQQQLAITSRLIKNSFPVQPLWEMFGD
jgi:hypothetical protein